MAFSKPSNKPKMISPDHKIFDAKVALYITSTNSLSTMGFNYEALAYIKTHGHVSAAKRDLQEAESS